MKTMLKPLVSLVCILAILLVGGCAGKSTPVEPAPPANAVPETPAEPAIPAIVHIGNVYGFTNADGSVLLVPGETDRPQRFKRAVGDCGAILTLAYAGEQAASADDSGRFTAYNFDNLAGERFTVTEGMALGNETYYLLDETEFDSRTILDTQPGDSSPLDAADAAQLTATRDRAVSDSWELASTEVGLSVYLVLFEPREEDLLAGIAVKTPQGILLKDFPATRDGSSAWRVDDGGTMSPSLFDVLFLASTGDRLLLGINWLGAEGEATLLLQGKNGALEDLDLGFYRYTYPA